MKYSRLANRSFLGFFFFKPLWVAPCAACTPVSGTPRSCWALSSAGSGCAAGTSSHHWQSSWPKGGGGRFFNNSKPMTYNTTNRLTFKQDNVLVLKEIAVKLHLSPRMPGASWQVFPSQQQSCSFGSPVPCPVWACAHLGLPWACSPEPTAASGAVAAFACTPISAPAALSSAHVPGFDVSPGEHTQI